MLESPFSGLEKDRNWTGLDRKKRPDCSLGLSYLKIKDRKNTGLFRPVQTGLDRSLVA